MADSERCSSKPSDSRSMRLSTGCTSHPCSSFHSEPTFEITKSTTRCFRTSVDGNSSQQRLSNHDSLDAPPALSRNRNQTSESGVCHTEPQLEFAAVVALATRTAAVVEKVVVGEEIVAHDNNNTLFTLKLSTLLESSAARDPDKN